ncbi:MAG: sulfopyruvate decarboxylase subunit alpha [Firmicutes bacterium]|nr:sulfopyruvate decarboxylase subunit alpha [Bacillota bacterium]
MSGGSPSAPVPGSAPGPAPAPAPGPAGRPLPWADAILDGLKRAGIDLIVTVPDMKIVSLIRAVAADGSMELVRAAREDEAVGIAAGAVLGGRRAAVLIQNAGLLASVNALACLDGLFGIPLLLLVSYRGDMGERERSHRPVGKATEPVLKALGLPYFVLRKVEDASDAVVDAAVVAGSGDTAAALLLSNALFRNA